MYNFGTLKEKIRGVEEWLGTEFTQIRTGRASPAILDKVRVESYGSELPINQVASVSIEDPRTIRISPWDMSLSKHIEKAITVADLGVSVSADDRGVRVSFPELTTDRRQMLVKLAKDKLEQARVSLRSERDRTMKEIEAKEKEGGMGEDDKFRLKAELQKMIDEANKKLEETFEKKEKEIMS